MFIDEEFEKLSKLENWNIKEDNKDKSKTIEFLNKENELIIIYAEAIYSKDIIKFILRVTDVHGRTFYFDSNFNYFNKDKYTTDKFFMDKLDSIQFWALQNRIPSEVVKCAWAKSYNVFNYSIYLAQMNYLYFLCEQQELKEKQNKPRQDNLF